MGITDNLVKSWVCPTIMGHPLVKSLVSGHQDTTRIAAYQSDSNTTQVLEPGIFTPAL